MSSFAARIFCSSVSLAFAMTIAASAQEAQPPPVTPVADAPPMSEIEEIVVTVQKREQSLQDIGISVTAFSGDELNELGISSSVDIAAHTPNLRIGFPAGESQAPTVFLRGVGLNDFNANANPSVGWYTDDIYISQTNGQNFGLFDLERVEVARGPQGTLYGRNTTGGLVNFISKKPNHSESDGFFTASYGSWNRVELTGAYGAPITDTLAARVAATFRRADGYLENDFPGGSDGNEMGNWAGRGQLSWQPSETVSVLFNVHGAQNFADADQYEHVGTMDDSAGFAQCADTGRPIDTCVDAFGYRDDSGNERGAWNRDPANDVDAWGTWLKLEAELGEVTVTSLTGYEWLDKSAEEDTDGGPNRMLEIDWDSGGWQVTQELRAAYASERLTVVAGAYYSRERLDITNSADVFRDNRTAAELAGCPTGFDPFGLVCGVGSWVGDVIIVQRVETAALFGQAEYDVLDALRVVLGFRYTWEWRDFAEDNGFFREDPALCAAYLGDPTCHLFPHFEDDARFDEWSGKVGLEWRPREGALVFASVSRGFKSGGFNGGFVFSTDELSSFDPELLTAYELGTKLTLLERRAQLSLTGFYYDYNDMQVFTLVNSGGLPTQALDNASDAEVYGAEVELALFPVEGLELSLGVGWVESELIDFESFGGPDYSGNDLAMAPSVTLNGEIAYEHSLGAGMLRLSTDFSYQSSIFFDTPNNPLLREDAYGLWNTRAAYQFGGDNRFEVAVFARNLLDKNYLAYVGDLSSTFGALEQMWGRPRSGGLEATMRF